MKAPANSDMNEAEREAKRKYDVLEHARHLYNSARYAVGPDAKQVIAGIARALQQYGDERVAAARPIAGASATQVASRVWYTKCDGKVKSPGWIIQAYAQAMQAYGDERAAAAVKEEQRRQDMRDPDRDLHW